MLRSIGKSCLASAYTWSGAAQLIARVRKSPETPFIAGYHRVVEDFDRSEKATIPAMLISTAMLEQHIDSLSKRFSFASLDEVGVHLAEGRRFRRPTAAITFDDGYSDVYHHAFPLLKKKGIPAAVFVVAGLVGTEDVQIFDRFYSALRLLQKRGRPLAKSVASALRVNGLDAASIEHLRSSNEEPFRLMTIALNTFPQRPIEMALASLEYSLPLLRRELDQMGPLTWDMVQEMHRAGIVIGSHTTSHCLLPCETSAKVRVELVTSKRILETRLRARVDHFAYPDGRFNAEVVRAVDSAGYRFAYGNCRFRDRNFPLLTIPRKMLWERSCLNVLGRFSPSVMNCQVHWLFDRKSHCDHDHEGSYPSSSGLRDETSDPSQRLTWNNRLTTNCR
jgi:peptidoglycan/xylan/chitin deacetylase (PgdA/CDA1 family)